MKKNGTMRVAVLLLALTLISSCFVGSTFAKYITTTTGSDSARVAYWGFDAESALTIELFNDVYVSETSSVTGNTVDSENGDNLVAPGTEGSATFAFGYTAKTSDKNALTAGAIAAPEVAYTFTVEAEITGDYDALNANKNFYWTLKAPSATEATKYQTVAELVAAIEALSGEADGSKVYMPGQLPAAFTAADEVYTVGWEWVFETDLDANAVDTAMGNAQDLDDVTISITIIAEQVD